MRKSILATTIISMALASPAASQELVQGWSVQMRADPFAGYLTPVALMVQSGQQFGGAQMTLHCAMDGSVAVGFAPNGFSFESSVTVDFRGPDGVFPVTFTGTETRSGRYRVASAVDSAAIIQAIQSGGDEIAFRDDDASGSFSTIGFAAVLDFTALHCSS